MAFVLSTCGGQCGNLGQYSAFGRGACFIDFACFFDGRLVEAEGGRVGGGTGRRPATGRCSSELVPEIVPDAGGRYFGYFQAEFHAWVRAGPVGDPSSLRCVPFHRPRRSSVSPETTATSDQHRDTRRRAG